MRKDNPHLTKKHGQRRKNRRFSMQAFQRHGGTATSAVGGTISSILGGGGDKHDHDLTKHRKIVLVVIMKLHILVE